MVERHIGDSGEQPGAAFESIATMPGNRSLRMTLTFARIVTKTVADEHSSASMKIDATLAVGDEDQAGDHVGGAFGVLRVFVYRDRLGCSRGDFAFSVPALTVSPD